MSPLSLSSETQTWGQEDVADSCGNLAKVVKALCA